MNVKFLPSFSRRLESLPKKFLLASAILGLAAAGCATLSGDGFVDLFDGKTLAGWSYIGQPGGEYFVTNGVMVCPQNSSGNLVTKDEYSNFIFRFEYKCESNANNGVAVRVPLSTQNLTYVGVEVQLLDDTAPMHRNLQPWQYNGSIYGIAPAKNGTGKLGEWNKEEITCRDRHYKIVLNGRVIVDTDLNDVRDPETLRTHPGMLRERGHLGFLGHSSHFEFRNISVKELPSTTMDNTPPPGFAALFDGRDLAGWQGLVADPRARAKMSPQQLAQEQQKADQQMTNHWRAENGEIIFDGKGKNLCSQKEYGDFELLVDWKIPARGDSGIYLRGSPQVQIWEPHSPNQFTPPDGSGGLWNNEKNSRHTLKFADKPVGEWNCFRILMVGEKVHVFLNGELVVNNTTLENYWERDRGIYPRGPIELQNHGGPLWFKNIYVRELGSGKSPE